MQGKTPKPDLMVPEKKLQNLSFSSASPKAFRHWVDSLPLTNTGESSRQLYNAIVELNQLDVPPPQQLQLLELIRPSIHHTGEQLEQHFLGYAITLPEKQRKIANLSQALQLHLAHGYKQALMGLVEKGAPDKQRSSLALAAHRAITDMGAAILRSAQLYSATPVRCWHESHQIYRYMLGRQYHQIEVQDTLQGEGHDSTVEEAYKQLLLFGCCRPNQLRQRELKQVYTLFAHCAPYTKLEPANGCDSLFLVDTVRDLPPIYRSQLKDRTSAIDLGFETRDLARLMSNYLDAAQTAKKPQEPFLGLNYRVSESVLMHLSQSLGSQSTRTSDRIASHGQLLVALGMSALHYYCAAQTHFNAFLANSGETNEQNFFLSNAQRNDPWASAFDVENPWHLGSPDAPINFRGASGSVQDGSQKTDTTYPSYTVPLVNKSPSGYCLKWTAEVPVTLQAGEIMGLREGPGEPWSIAVIRWIRQFKEQGTHIGVELMASNASPCGARLVQKSGQNSEYLRALLLPPVMESGQGHTLITPRLPFQRGHRIMLFHNQQSEQTQLSKTLIATGSISQFALKYAPSETGLLGDQNLTDRNSDDEDFDSLWPSL
ncbi:MAG: GTPase [Oleiphilaceae bacterium]|nr:GTPase [Oleiphilaceae bacterium]